MLAMLEQMRTENALLKQENQALKARFRLDRTSAHVSADVAVADDTPPKAAPTAEASEPDADLATATAWVGMAFMAVGNRFASGGMRDVDVPRKAGHTNGNLGGGTITLAQMKQVLETLSQDVSGVLEMYDPYQVYPWQKNGPSDIAYGIKEPAVFPNLKGKIVDPDGGGTHKGPFVSHFHLCLNPHGPRGWPPLLPASCVSLRKPNTALRAVAQALFQQRMLNFGGGGDPNAPEGSRTNYFAGYGRQDIPHVHIPTPQPEVNPARAPASRFRAARH